jgi:hypothetical protein
MLFQTWDVLSPLLAEYLDSATPESVPINPIRACYELAQEKSLKFEIRKTKMFVLVPKSA